MVGCFGCSVFVGFVQRSAVRLIQGFHKQPSHDIKSSNRQPMDRETYHRAWQAVSAVRLFPKASRLFACFREFDLDGVFGRLGGLDTRNALDWVAETSLRFHWKKDLSERLIDWQNCAVGSLDRSHRAIRSAQIWAVFEDAKRDISKISLRELG